MIASRQPAVLQLVPRLDADEIGRETLDLARHLRARGWRSLVASGGGSLLRELTAAGVTHLPVPLRDEGRLTRWRSAGRLARAIREHRVALVHAQAPSVAATGLDAARSAAVPLVASLRDLAALLSRRSLDALPQVDRLVVASEYLAEAAVERVRVTTDRVRVVRRWVDLAEFDPERVRGHRVSALADRWGLVAGAKVLVVPALPDGDRGHLLLLHAMARLPRTDCVALFAGGFEAAGVYGKELMAAVRRAGLGERVRFGGRTDDLPALLALADLVVLPTTLPESGGHVAAAAQAMGRPVIVCNRGALAEAVMPASTGWLVPAEDPDELARALDLALAMDEPTRRRLATRARDFVAGEFGLVACADRMLAVYRELSELPLARAG